VLIFGDRVVIGLSGRTNEAGARQLEAALRELGYRVWLCPVTNSRLHFASAVTVVRPTRFIGVQIGYDDLDAVSHEILPRDEIDRVVIPDEELPAHNVLPVDGTIFIPARNPVAASLLREAGEHVVEIPFEHITRADAGMTCLVCRVY
jgi:dimethylargininase